MKAHEACDLTYESGFTAVRAAIMTKIAVATATERKNSLIPSLPQRKSASWTALFYPASRPVIYSAPTPQPDIYGRAM